MQKQHEVRVIVVDDMLAEAEMLSLALEMQGYTVRTASSGGEALEMIDEFAPRCVLLDITMSGLGGHELSRRLRKRYGKEIMLVAVSDMGRADERASATFVPFDHYFSRPLEPTLLRKLLPPAEGRERKA